MRYFLAIVAVTLVAAGCGKSPESPSVVARVGDVELTVDDLPGLIDTTTPGWRSQIPRVVSSWVTTELLAQEARRTGVEDDPAYVAGWNEAQRQLLANRYLAVHVYGDTVSLPEEAMRSYFQAHAGEFFLREDVVKLNMVAFQTREQASAFAAQAVGRATWGDYLAERMHDPLFTSGIVTSRQNMVTTKRSTYPPEVWKVATTLPLNEVSFPVRSPAGYYVVQPLAVYRQGSPAEFDLVRDEVRSRLLVEYRREQVSKRLGTLRERYNVQVFVTPELQSDSTETGPHE